MKQTYLNMAFVMIEIPNYYKRRIILQVAYFHANFILRLIEVRVVTLTAWYRRQHIASESTGIYKINIWTIIWNNGGAYMRHLTLTHWGRMMHICVSKLTIIRGLDNGFLPGRRQAII